jgi:hypothetical protein
MEVFVSAFFNFLAGMLTLGVIWLGNVSLNQEAQEYDTAGLLAVIKANEDARPVILTTEQQNAILRDLWEVN